MAPSPKKKTSLLAHLPSEDQKIGRCLNNKKIFSKVLKLTEFCSEKDRSEDRGQMVSFSSSKTDVEHVRKELSRIITANGGVLWFVLKDCIFDCHMRIGVKSFDVLPDNKLNICTIMEGSNGDPTVHVSAASMGQAVLETNHRLVALDPLSYGASQEEKAVHADLKTKIKRRYRAARFDQFILDGFQQEYLDSKKKSASVPTMGSMTLISMRANMVPKKRQHSDTSSDDDDDDKHHVQKKSKKVNATHRNISSFL